MNLKQIKKLGLPKVKELELIKLKEKELRLEKLISGYDPYWVDKELQEIDVLLVKKKELIEKLKSGGRKELNDRLILTKKQQLDLITQHGVLGKIRKVINEVKKIESITKI